MNIQYPTLNNQWPREEKGTSNIKHPTSNDELRKRERHCREQEKNHYY
jgi:hypothetical protein